MNATHALLTGLTAIVALWILLGLTTHSFNPARLIDGTDGTLSTSKLQLLLWTVIIVFSYVVLFSFLARATNFAELGVPTNVLIAVGISVTTAVTSKAVAVSNANNPAPPPPPDPAVIAAAAVALAAAPPDAQIAAVAAPAPASQAGIFQGDDGSPDLGKIQLMIWTIVAIAIYLVKVHHQLAIGVRQMPDIDQTLMILMGLGHGAYLGKKIAANGGS